MSRIKQIEADIAALKERAAPILHDLALAQADLEAEKARESERDELQDNTEQGGES